ncbi:MAG TPA: hypothetical protein PKA06_09545, partial [Gemmatales bacterium]|nr:hypothetical protein [Gemmatales bacterium]
MPPRLQSLRVTLSAEVKSLSTSATVPLSYSETFELNSIDLTDHLEDLHLARFGENYIIEVLGKTGEPKADRPVQLALKHREFREPVTLTLKSDATGRVQLGKLADIQQLTATNGLGVSHTWPLPLSQASYPALVHGIVGNTVTLPYTGTAQAPQRNELALFEIRGAAIRADRFQALSLQNGLITITGLEAGDYDLLLKRQGTRVRIRMAVGT